MSKKRLFILGAALALAAAIATPVLAGSRISATVSGSDAPAAEIYAPTGEPIDLTITVVATRLSD